MNAGKKRDEALAMLDKLFPRLEAHLGQVKKYQATIDYLTQENKGLKEKAKDEGSIKKQLEAAKLKQENEQLRQFISKIPPEVRRGNTAAVHTAERTGRTRLNLYLEN